MSFTSTIIPPIIALGFAAPAAYIVLDRSLPTEVLAVAVETPHVKPGQELRLKFVVERHRTCTVITRGLLVDSSGAETDFTASLPMITGPSDIASRDYEQTLPDGVLPGPARFILYASYSCNPIHSIWPITHVNADVRFIVDDPLAGETAQKESGRN